MTTTDPRASSGTASDAAPSSPNLGRAVILLNFFEVREADDERFLNLWSGLRDFLSRQPGFLSAQLHQSLSTSARYRYVNIAGWESPLAFQLATSQPTVREARVPFTFHAALYRVATEVDVAPAADADVIVINPFMAPAGSTTFIDEWRRAADALMEQPGYVCARLHRSLGAEGQFGYVNVARWRSTSDFRAAIGSRAFQSLPPPPVPNFPALYREWSPSASQ